MSKEKAPADANEDAAARVGAYLDRELRADQRGDVEARLFSDTQLRQLYRALGSDDARLKEDFDLVLAEPVPARILATIDREFAARGKNVRNSGFNMPLWAQIAAGVAVLFTGVLAASFWVETSLDRAVSEFAATVEADRRTLTQAVTQALETKSSGVAVRWTGAGESGGTITPVSTYRSVSGHWCREYVQEIRMDREDVSVRGVACRNDDGEWITLRAEPARPGRSEKGA